MSVNQKYSEEFQQEFKEFIDLNCKSLRGKSMKQMKDLRTIVRGSKYWNDDLNILAAYKGDKFWGVTLKVSWFFKSYDGGKVYLIWMNGNRRVEL